MILPLHFVERLRIQKWYLHIMVRNGNKKGISSIYQCKFDVGSNRLIMHEYKAEGSHLWRQKNYIVN